MVDRLFGRLMKRVEDVTGSREIRVADAEGDDVDTFGALGGDPLGDLSKQVRRQRLNALREFHHEYPVVRVVPAASIARRLHATDPTINARHGHPLARAPATSHRASHTSRAGGHTVPPPPTR